jgi:hypothetical protein
MVTPELAGTPHEGDTPIRWLERVGQLEAIRDWVITQGLTSSSSAEWASFAKAMGWELPIMEAAPPDVDTTTPTE